MMISFIIPTIGRPSLQATLASLETYPGDEILVIGGPTPPAQPRLRHFPCEPGGFARPASREGGGSYERELGIAAARNAHLAFIDDDDVYLRGHRAAMDDAIQQTPGRPVLFRMRYADGHLLWSDPALRQGNVSTQMFLIPNDRSKLGRWTARYESDYDFLATSKWIASDFVWRPEVIACYRPS